MNQEIFQECLREIWHAPGDPQGEDRNSCSHHMLSPVRCPSPESSFCLQPQIWRSTSEVSDKDFSWYQEPIWDDGMTLNDFKLKKKNLKFHLHYKFKSWWNWKSIRCPSSHSYPIVLLLCKIFPVWVIIRHLASGRMRSSLLNRVSMGQHNTHNSCFPESQALATKFNTTGMSSCKIPVFFCSRDG